MIGIGNQADRSRGERRAFLYNFFSILGFETHECSIYSPFLANKCINKWMDAFFKKSPPFSLKKTERQLTELEKIFANNMTNKELISNIYKQLIQLNIKKNKQTTQIKNGQKN